MYKFQFRIKNDENQTKNKLRKKEEIKMFQSNSPN